MSNRYVYWSVLASSALALSGCNRSTDSSAAVSHRDGGTGASEPSARAPAVAPAKVLAQSVLDAALPAGHCNLDAVNSTVLSDSAPTGTVKSGQTLFAGGWLTDTRLESPPMLTMVLQGSNHIYGLDGQTTVLRPDVAKMLNADTAARSGFNIAADLGTTPSGPYKVLLLFREAAKPEICDTRRQIIISH